jgi:hypothetical protein
MLLTPAHISPEMNKNCGVNVHHRIGNLIVEVTAVGIFIDRKAKYRGQMFANIIPVNSWLLDLVCEKDIAQFGLD